METKYLRPILTAKEPKNKNVLWCHDGKISYYDKEWKEVSGGGSSEITELPVEVLKKTLENISTNILIGTENGNLDVIINNGNNLICSHLNISSLTSRSLKLSSGGANCDLNPNEIITNGEFRFSSDDNAPEIFSLSSQRCAFNFSSLDFNLHSYNGLFGFANRIQDLNEGNMNVYLFLSTNFTNDGSPAVINLSTLITNPINVSTGDPSKWTLTDIQSILQAIKSAGYFRISTQP